MTITRDDLEPGDIFLISERANGVGDSLFEVLPEPVQYDDRYTGWGYVYVSCFFGPYSEWYEIKGKPHWLSPKWLTEVLFIIKVFRK